MNSMVGGTDVIFETARQGFDVGLILDAVIEIWPDGLFQHADEEDVRPLTGVLADQRAGASQEFFVYKDRASADSWKKEGWTEAHANDMLHFLVVYDAARPEMLQLTLVIGSITGETVRLVAAVFETLGRMASGEPALRGRSRRVDWETELRAAGYASGREQLFEKVDELSNALFPDWTADELVCHPNEAQQFCEVVRRVVAPIPDHLVMKALLNRRTQRKKGSAAFEPRLVWGG
jgi:hypothetical protein